MASLKPRLKPFWGERDRIRPGDADAVEAERLGAFDEGALQPIAV